MPTDVEPTGGLLRGAEAIRVYLNRRLIGGKPVSRVTVYRMIEAGVIPVSRLGRKGAELWARQADLDDLFAGVADGSETR